MAETPQLVAERQSVPARGNRYTPEQRQQIVDAAFEQIMQGRTLADIAAEHGVTARSLQYWLHDLGDEYAQLRQRWLDAMLADAGEELERADDQFRLARARELFKRATWYAERRDPQRYGQRQEVTVRQESLADVLARVGRTIDGAARTVPTMAAQSEQIGGGMSGDLPGSPEQ